MTPPRSLIQDAAMTFEEAREAHLLDFAETTPEQKLKWLGDMLALVQSVEEARDQERCSDTSPIA